MIPRFQNGHHLWTRMVLTMRLLGTLVSLAVVSAAAGGGTLRGGASSDPHTERELYEHDDEKSCLEEDFCRMTVGLVLICFAPLVICWNEHAHVRLEQLYRAAQRVIRELDNPFKIEDDDNLDRQFVCINGTLEGSTKLKDPLFPSSIQVDNALLLKREIEIFQYVQVKNSDDGYKVKERWCQLPRPDPDKFPEKKNPIGNWNLFGGDHKFDTGHTLRGQPILHKENMFVTRAPHPTLGTFTIPPALMDEGFLGVRNVYRLHEYQRIKESQGKWMNFVTPATAESPQGIWKNSAAPRINDSVIVPENPDGERIWRTDMAQYVTCRHGSGGYFYDGEPSRIGTIRIKWQYAPTQEVTIAAEAVAPGRPSSQGYGSMVHNLSNANPKKIQHMKDMIISELFQAEATKAEMQPLRTGAKANKELLACNGLEKNIEKWTLTPFEVTEQKCLPPYGDKVLGQLWLFAPGRLAAWQLFRNAHGANDKCLWVVRGMTYLMLLIGWMLLFGPLTRLFGPGIFRSILMFAFGMVAVILSTSCWITFSALACCTARPARSTLILAICWGLYVFWDQHYSDITMRGA
jgi:hypothetical protein